MSDSFVDIRNSLSLAGEGVLTSARCYVVRSGSRTEAFQRRGSQSDMRGGEPMYPSEDEHEDIHARFMLHVGNRNRHVHIRGDEGVFSGLGRARPFVLVSRS